jgi:mannose-6-phosphate isomerase-like protein (cupin superfamily)
MVVRKKQQLLQQRDNMRNGEGTIDIHHILSAEDLPKNSRLFARIVIRPGCSIGEHAHKEEAELFYVLSGMGMAADGDQKREIGTGDTLVTANGSHAIKNVGSEDLELLAVIITE